MSNESKEYILGIDFGTTNSSVAVFKDEKIIVIPNSMGNKKTSSTVALLNNGKWLIGEEAKKKELINPEQTVSSILRNILSEDSCFLNGKEYPPEKIAAIILCRLRKDAESFLGGTVTKAVVSVPSFLNYSQREAIRNAGRIAGLEVLQLISVSNAAALGYGYKKEDNEKILVLDVGGGTVNTAVLELGDGVFEEKATKGNNELGGDDFDQKLIDWMIEEFHKLYKFDLRNDKTAIARLKEAAEKAKIELSTVAQTDINIPFIRIVDGQHQNLEVVLTREKFNEMTSDLVENIFVTIEYLMSDVGITANEIDKVLLSGNTTRIGAIRDELVKSFGEKITYENNCDEWVVTGTAIKAGALTGEINDSLLLPVYPFSLGIETSGGAFTRFIDRNTTIPAKKSFVFTEEKENQLIFDIHILEGESEFAKKNRSLDCFQLSLAVSGFPGLVSPSDNIKGIGVEVASIFHKKDRDSSSVNEISKPRIEVVFDIDGNGILSVSAKDFEAGNSEGVVVKSKTNMSEDEIEKAMKELENLEFVLA